jgi:hypothetical protein
MVGFVRTLVWINDPQDQEKLAILIEAARKMMYIGGVVSYIQRYFTSLIQ